MLLHCTRCSRRTPTGARDLRTARARTRRGKPRAGTRTGAGRHPRVSAGARSCSTARHGASARPVRPGGARVLGEGPRRGQPLRRHVMRAPLAVHGCAGRWHSLLQPSNQAHASGSPMASPGSSQQVCMHACMACTPRARRARAARGAWRAGDGATSTRAAAPRASDTRRPSAPGWQADDTVGGSETILSFLPSFPSFLPRYTLFVECTFHLPVVWPRLL